MSPSELDALYFGPALSVAGAVVELRGLDVRVACDLAGSFEVAAGVLVERDAGRAEGVIADVAGQAGGLAPALDHEEGAALGERLAGEFAPMSGGILPERGVGVLSNSGEGDVGVEVLAAAWCAGTTCSLPFFSWRRKEARGVPGAR